MIPRPVAGGTRAAHRRRLRFGIGQSVTAIDRHQPQLVIAEVVDMTQDRIVDTPAGLGANEWLPADRRYEQRLLSTRDG